MDPEVAAAVAEAHRTEWAYVVAAAARLTRDIDLAEECAQEAFAQALTSWSAGELPRRPGAWLTMVARRRAMDLIRRQDALRERLPLLVDADPSPEEDIPDDRLRLIFTCCHPALAPDARAALTLRLVCGLSTTDVAHAFLVGESTMAARITRAKQKISAARIPYREPPPEELAARIDAVLDVVHLLFTTGHTSPGGGDLQRRELAESAVRLARMLHLLLPRHPGPTGLLALVLLTDARRNARTTPAGRLATLEHQDRDVWDHDQIREGLGLVQEAMRYQPPTRYALMAAIAAVHSRAADWTATDWREIVALYDVLTDVWPSPVVALNRAIAVGEAFGPEQGLAALTGLGTEPQLGSYPYLASARATFLRRLGRVQEARIAYQEALLLTDNAVESDFLESRIRELGEPVDPDPSPYDG